MIHRVLCPSRPGYRPGAFGVRAVLFALALGLGTIRCTPVGMPSAEPEPTQPALPSIEEGTLPGNAAAEGERILQDGNVIL